MLVLGLEDLEIKLISQHQKHLCAIDGQVLLLCAVLVQPIMSVLLALLDMHLILHQLHYAKPELLDVKPILPEHQLVLLV